MRKGDMRRLALSKIRTHKFLGRVYRILWRCPTAVEELEAGTRRRALETTHGMCTPPWQPNRRIFIDPGLSEATLLETALHEADHAVDFAAQERKVDRRNKQKARFLRRMGFRLCTCGNCRCQ